MSDFKVTVTPIHSDGPQSLTAHRRHPWAEITGPDLGQAIAEAGEKASKRMPKAPSRRPCALDIHVEVPAK